MITPKQRFDLIYAPKVKQHLRTIDRKFHSLVRRTLETQLQPEPDVETNNRKPLKRTITFEADWELCSGPDNRFRAFYQVDWKHGKVYILAIGVKQRDRLFIGEEEVEL